MAECFWIVRASIAAPPAQKLAALAYRGTAALVDGEVRLTSEATRWRTLDTVFTRLEADLRQAQPRPIRVGAAREPAWLAATEAHGSSAIVFSRAGPEWNADPGTAGQRVGYRLRESALEVVYWPGLDRSPGTREPAWTLVNGVTRLRIEHLGADGGWGETWPRFGEREIPRAVRVLHVLDSGRGVGAMGGGRRPASARSRRGATGPTAITTSWTHRSSWAGSRWTACRADERWLRFAIYPESALTPAVWDSVSDAMRRLAIAHNRIFGGPPYETYTVLFYAPFQQMEWGGGLEHHNSQLDAIAGPFFAPDRRAGRLGDFTRPLLSHELFHLFNVKRIRPAEMWPYDYSREQFTPLLWWSEGVTDYFSDVTMVRAGLWSVDRFIQSVSGNIAQVEDAAATTSAAAAPPAVGEWQPT